MIQSSTFFIIKFVPNSKQVNPEMLHIVHMYDMYLFEISDTLSF